MVYFVAPENFRSISGAAVGAQIAPAVAHYCPAGAYGGADKPMWQYEPPSNVKDGKANVWPIVIQFVILVGGFLALWFKYLTDEDKTFSGFYRPTRQTMGFTKMQLVFLLAYVSMMYFTFVNILFGVQGFNNVTFGVVTLMYLANDFLQAKTTMKKYKEYMFFTLCMAISVLLAVNGYSGLFGLVHSNGSNPLVMIAGILFAVAFFVRSFFFMDVKDDSKIEFGVIGSGAVVALSLFITLESIFIGQAMTRHYAWPFWILVVPTVVLWIFQFIKVFKTWAGMDVYNFIYASFTTVNAWLLLLHANDIPTEKQMYAAFAKLERHNIDISVTIAVLLGIWTMMPVWGLSTMSTKSSSSKSSAV